MLSKRFLLSAVLATGAVSAAVLIQSMYGPAVLGDETARPTHSDAAPQAYFGVGVAPLSPVLSAQLPEATSRGRGVVVASVMADSPAAKAGLRLHDILVQYDKQDVYSPEQLVKLVRNDKPGRDVVVSYVRAGKILEAKVTLGETAAKTDIRGNMARRGDDQGRNSVGRERARQSDPAPWAQLESLTVTRIPDGRFKAQIDFHDQDQKIVHREYVGSREEIRQALEQDKELPADQREHLLRTIDQQQPHLFQFVLPRSLRDWIDPDLSLFNWPHTDF